MNIGTISDLHIDRTTLWTEEDFIGCLVDEISQQQIDILLIAGDISNDYRRSCYFIKRLKVAAKIDIYFVPGNHDFWSTDDTNDILAYFTAEQECLIHKPVLIGDEWAIVGHCGWYNYAYGDSKFTEQQFERGKFKGSTWQDKMHLNWGLSDKMISQKFTEQIKADIKHVGERKIILMTHIVTHPKFTVPKPNRIFDFYNAFIGTSDIAPLYTTENIYYSIMGHVHFRGRFKEDTIEYLCPCLGYTREWRTKELKVEIHHALQCIQL